MNGSVVGEEQLVEDDARHNPVQKEVVPFDGGSEQTGKDDLGISCLLGALMRCSLGRPSAARVARPPVPWRRVRDSRGEAIWWIRRPLIKNLIKTPPHF